MTPHGSRCIQKSRGWRAQAGRGLGNAGRATPRGAQGSNERGVSVEPSETTSHIALCEGDRTPPSPPLLAGWPGPSEVP